ncbi:MAG: 4-(cytidine 5'-diphospho)-2-C-methyl-D-erythritol kinase [bacterium]
MKILAFAKVNFILEILGPRPDGYHELVTVFQNVGLADEIEFEPAERGISLEINSGKGLEVKGNLILRAARKLQKHTGDDKQGVSIRLTKKIPVGAGLGGGSADAAATLVALNRLWQRGLSDEDLQQIGSEIGSDVAFFIRGGAALGEGRGERLTPLGEGPVGHAVIVRPPFSISTADAFKAYRRRSDWGPPRDPARMVEAVGKKNLNLVGGELFNRFENVLYGEYPVLAAIRHTLAAAGCCGAVLSGSGSCAYGLVEKKEEAEAIARKLNLRECEVFAVPLVSEGVRFQDVTPTLNRTT